MLSYKLKPLLSGCWRPAGRRGGGGCVGREGLGGKHSHGRWLTRRHSSNTTRSSLPFLQTVPQVKATGCFQLACEQLGVLRHRSTRPTPSPSSTLRGRSCTAPAPAPGHCSCPSPPPQRCPPPPNLSAAARQRPMNTRKTGNRQRRWRRHWQAHACEVVFCREIRHWAEPRWTAGSG